VANIGEPLRVFEEPEDDPVAVPGGDAGGSPGRAGSGGYAVSIIAFRRWQVDDSGYLMPLNRGTTTTWRPGTARFKCGCGGGRYSPHEHIAMGQAGNTCGLYSYQQPIAACQCGTPDDPQHGAVGVVRIWGEVCEHERGWRSSMARPVAVVDYTGRLAADYDVPRYPDLDAMYGEWAPDLQPVSVDAPIWCNSQWAVITSSMVRAQVDFQAMGDALQRMFGGGITISGILTAWMDPAEEEYRAHCRALGLDDTAADEILSRARTQAIWLGDVWDTAKNFASLTAAGATISRAWEELAIIAATVDKASRTPPPPKAGPPPPAPGHRAYGKRGRRARR
jgi:hypothetical protein